MKKILSLFLVAVMVFSFVACAGEKSEAGTTEKTATSAPVSADENLLTVTINLSASFFEDSTEEEIKKAAEENGISKCVVNEDGSVTYTMTKSKHKELLEELKESMNESIDGLINGENKVESFVEIKPNEDLSEFNVYVDPNKYSAWDSMNVLVFYVQGAYYQCFAGEEFDKIDVIVNFIDNETQEVINTASYRDYIDNMNKSED